MNRARRAFAQKAYSSILIFALAFTLMPLPHPAYADEPASSNAEQNGQAIGSSSAQAGNQSATSASAIMNGEAVDKLNVTTVEADEMPAVVKSSVVLEDTATTVFTQNGLNYLTTNNGEAALVGWSVQPNGVLSVPAEVTFNTETLAVTKIVMGGGSLNPRIRMH